MGSYKDQPLMAIKFYVDQRTDWPEEVRTSLNLAIKLINQGEVDKVLDASAMSRYMSQLGKQQIKHGVI